MADDEKNTPMETVSWRLPTRIACDNAGDWTAFREHLEAWAQSGDRLEVDRDETTNACLRMPSHVLAALSHEAQRLSKRHGKRFTPGSVARLVWDQWEPRELVTGPRSSAGGGSGT